MSWVVSFAVGLIFGAGLMISGMTEPAKVLGFLDVAGSWDPSLALVMGGAVAVGLIAFRIAGRRPGGLAQAAPTAIDARLVVGSAIFGIGWGLVGFCPGPAITNLGFADAKAAVFVLAMVAGMALHKALTARGP
jgi:uncharacterized membrane protein YedE/YeeE